MSSKRKEIFEFGEFRLDVDEHTIERIDGVRNGSLTEKAFQALVLLVRRRGHLVSKDEMIGFIWPDTIVEDNNLEKCIHQLRNFLGETSNGSKYIETVRKHGYRFVEQVDTVDVSSSWLPETFRPDNGKNGSAVPTVDPLTQPEPESQNTVVALATWRREAPEDDKAGSEIPPYNHRESSEPESRIALAGPETDNAELKIEARKMTKRRQGLRRGLRFLLWGLGVGFVFLVLQQVLRIAAVLNVQYEALPGGAANVSELVAGLLTLLVIPVQLGVFVGLGLFLFGGARIVYALFEREGSQIVVVLVERIIVGVIILALLSIAIPNTMYSYRQAQRARLIRQGAKQGTSNQEANQFYLMAMNLSEERGVPNVRKALEYLDQAVALDSNYALAWAGKALTHNDVVSHSDGDPHENYQSSMEAIRKALDIDPNLSEAHSALCHNKNRYEYDVAGAETACKRAVELDPNSPVAHKTYANFLYTRGRFDEAIVEIKRAMDLQPVSYRNQQMYALTLYYARRYAEAEEQFKRLIELNPNHSYIHGRLIRVLEDQGKEAEAFEYLVKMLTIQKDSEKLERFRTAYQASGWSGVVIEQIKTAEAGPKQGHFQLACLYSKIGNKDKAFENLEKAYQERSFQIAILEVEPQLERLRDDPRFADLIRRVYGK